MTTQFTSDPVAKFRPLADSIKENLHLHEGSIQEKVPGKSYEDNLPPTITMDTVKAVSVYNGTYITSAHVAVGEVAADVFKADKSVSTIEAELAFNGPRDTISISVDRTHTFQNHLAKDPADKTVVKNLSMTTQVDTKGARGISLKRVKDAMSAEFDGSFKK